MDIGVKERVIGAAVLVVLGIIIIPWVLQGPAPDSSVTRSVALPAASTSSTPREYRMDLSDHPAAPAPDQLPATGEAVKPAPVASVPATQNTSQPSTTNVPAAPKTRPIERQPTSQAAASGAWMVQAGSYGSERNALKLQNTLKQHGYSVVISRYKTGKTTYYRVRVGPYKERVDAEKAIPAIDHIYGGKAKVVPNS